MEEKLKRIEIGIIGSNKVARALPMSEEEAELWYQSFWAVVQHGDSIRLPEMRLMVPAHAVAWIEIVDYNEEE
jgi:hypothetical protein|nr:MAG TPA: hypothetical protein [Caudoviricetes sp.]